MNDEPVITGRKILREDGNVQMWQELVAGPHRSQVLRYYLGRSGERGAEFTAPHLAFHHFQKLTGVAASPPARSIPPKRKTTSAG
jgi:hypothetical protein